MNVNVPIPATVVQNKPLQQSYGKDASNDSQTDVSSKSNGKEFKSIYEKYTTDSSAEDDSVKIENADMDGKSSSIENKDIQVKTDSSESALNTPENLIALLINLYIQNGEVSISDTVNTKSAESVSATSNKVQSGNLQEVIRKLISEEQIPSDLKKILSQYNELASSQQGTKEIPGELLKGLSEDTSKELTKDATKLKETVSNIFAAEQGKGIHKARELNEFKNAVIARIRNMLGQVDNNNSQKENASDLTGVNPLDLARKIVTGNASISSDDDGQAKMQQFTEKNNIREIDNGVVEAVKNYFSAEKVNKADKVSKLDKLSKTDDDKFLQSLLKDNGTQKTEGKLNMFMNLLNNTKGSTFEVNKQDGQVLVNKTSFTNDIFKAVKFMNSNDIKELKVNINPKDLGELVISVTVESGKMKASISANNREAYNLLNANLNEIKNSLISSDIRIQDFSIGIYNGDTTFFKDGSQNQRNQEQNYRPNGKGHDGDPEQELTVESAGYGNNDNQINILA